MKRIVQALLRKFVYEKKWQSHTHGDEHFGVKHWYCVALRVMPKRVAGWLDVMRVSLDEWSWQ